MRILLSNDDGVFAPGLTVLEEIARSVTDDVWIVAPHEEQSGKSRAVTLNSPVRVRQEGEKRFAVTGTPADAVLLGVMDILKDHKPDLVLSGVNRGQNIAEDTSQSGTVAAAVEGMHLGIPSIAFSQARNFRRGEQIPWETGRAWGPRVLKALLASPWPKDVVMNVNFPDRLPQDVEGVEVTRQGFRDEAISTLDKRTDLRGNDYFWIGYTGKLSEPPEGTDLRAVYEGRISITPLHIDMTHHAYRDALAKTFRAPDTP
ncbi:MAG: 5'/3'-nucleotidase SurE [Alphaproteobacteria bacterium]|nr:5'/3'-nucleotidase SurE [Alphaproteobacteria bacterium]